MTTISGDLRPYAMPTRSCLLLPFSLGMFLAPGVWSQSLPAKDQDLPLSYDVVAIKPDKSGSGNISWRSTADGFIATNITLKMLIVSAYDIREGLIFGLPAWAESAHFDMNAKIAEVDPEVLKKQTPAQVRAMMATVLADRFHLKVHTETKNLPVYELIVVKGGPKFKENLAAPEENGPAPPGGKPRSGLAPGNSMWNNGEMTGVAVPLAVLERSLEAELDRNIVDRTGLAGKYDLHLKWTPDRATGGGDAEAPPLFTALEDQLGLKLQPAKGMVATLVVDHVEQPTDN